MRLASSEGGYNQYLFEYRFDDSEWGLTITAKSPEEARERLKSISWAQYRGEIAAIIPIPGAGLLSRIGALLRS
jgi:hypothetical protein